jgi:arginyl-tRNA synthetase
MTTLACLKHEIKKTVQELFSVDATQCLLVTLHLNLGDDAQFGDLSCNAAMMLARVLGKNPRQLAETFKAHLLSGTNDIIKSCVKDVQIAGPGFVNITLFDHTWSLVARELFSEKDEYFRSVSPADKRRYLIEFVSANPTGPLHLGAGRNGIIGDILARVLKFIGHDVLKEYYINDAGNQMKLLGDTLKARCCQQLGIDERIPEEGYAGQYMIDLARECVSEFGDALICKDSAFFSHYAKEHMLQLIKKDLQDYDITFDNWFSEKTLHEDGSINRALELLQEKGLAYESEGALWFKSTEFGDDKDRVVRKTTGELTYIAADIAYHKSKYDRGYDHLIDILGQDHHGYVKRLKGTMQAMGYAGDQLDVILYQLVSIKENDVAVKMSKRAGSFTTLREVIDTVGADVARFFYVNRKAEAHLEFDLAVAMKKTDENPVFYIQYAYVRTYSIFAKALQDPALQDIAQQLIDGSLDAAAFEKLSGGLLSGEIAVIKKIASLSDVLQSIAATNQTHLIAYYAWELAHTFHNYYANNRILDPADAQRSSLRLGLVKLVRQTLALTLDLLGVSKPEKM